jgi:hypothetical protein
MVEVSSYDVVVKFETALSKKNKRSKKQTMQGLFQIIFSDKFIKITDRSILFNGNIFG